MCRFASTYFPIFVALVASGSSLVCDDPSDLNTGTCAQLSKDLERALVQDEGNLFRLRRFFLHSPTATPVLLKVLYNVTFAENFTTAVAAEEVPNCLSPILNSSIELTQRNITLGWTSSGVYVVFHPTVLSVMQVQSPFTFLRIFHLILNQRSPEADSFLWDGSYDLPTIHINLHITSMLCVPSYDLFDSLLIEMNALLKIYGGHQKEIKEIVKDQVESIGHTLPETHVSSKVIPIGSDVIFINLYTSILCILHTISVCVIIVYYFPSNRSKQNKSPTNGSKESPTDSSKESLNDGSMDSNVRKFIDQLISDNYYDDLFLGIRITSNTTLFVEVLIRLVTIIIWTQNSRDFLGTFLAVWMPNLQLLVVAVGLNLVLNICILKNSGCRCCDSGHEYTSLRTFFTLYGTVFVLLYIFFPTIILTFAYPTRMLVIFAFVVAYLFVTSVFSATIVKLYNHNEQNKRTKLDYQQCFKHNEDKDDKTELQSIQTKEKNAQQCSQEKQKLNSKSSEESNSNYCCGCDLHQMLSKMSKFLYYFLLYFIPLWMIILYLHFLMLFVLYMLLIGRATVISTGPTFIISLFTPALLSSIGVAVLKKTTLIKGSKEKKESAVPTTPEDNATSENTKRKGITTVV